MVQVRIGFGSKSGDLALERGVVVRIRPIGQSGRPLSLVAPVGQGVSSHAIDLNPGRYQFEAVLPSGQVIAEVQEIHASPQSQDVVISGGDSPQDDFNWQRFMGNLARPVYMYEQMGIANQSPSTTTKFFSERIHPGHTGIISLFVEKRLETRQRGDLLAGLHDLIDGHVRENAPPSRIIEQGPVRSWVLDQPPDISRLHLERHWLAAEAGPRSLLCILPYPWQRLGYDGWSAVDLLLVPPGSGEDAEFQVTCAVRDPLVGSVLGYLGRGDLPAAGEILSTAVELLFNKLANPLAAAAGAYALVQDWILKGRSRDPQWQSWVENLKNRFLWLPDGAILHGWLLLKGRDEPDVQQAREAFLEAGKRGVPFYSAGVRILRDGLALLNGDVREDQRSDPELEVGFRRASMLARRVNVRQPFTVLDLS